jgi:ABC-type amino acid transport substrate-binding protein
MRFKKLVLSLIICLSLIKSSVSAPVKVGVVFFYPPYVLSMNEGFDISLVQLLFHRLKLSYELIPMELNKLFSSLEAGDIDIAIGGISISPEREGKFIFSLPYMLSKAQFLILNTSKYTLVTDLGGAQVGVMQGNENGGIFYNFLLNNFSGLFNVVKFNDMESLISSLTSGNISAAFTHQPTANYWLQNGGHQFRKLGSPMIVGAGIAIMSIPANAALIQKINQQLQAMENDNTYINLYTTYFGNN